VLYQENASLSDIWEYDIYHPTVSLRERFNGSQALRYALLLCIRFHLWNASCRDCFINNTTCITSTAQNKPASCLTPNLAMNRYEFFIWCKFIYIYLHEVSSCEIDRFFSAVCIISLKQILCLPQAYRLPCWKCSRNACCCPLGFECTVVEMLVYSLVNDWK
jgi:hypothetical protein